MVGYSCQISRYCTAAKQYSETHTYTKGLAKKFVAHVNPGSVSEKKLVFIIRNITLHYAPNVFDRISIAYFPVGTKANSPFYFHPDYLSPHLFSGGKRGPPFLA